MKRITILSILLYLCCDISIAQNIDPVQAAGLHSYMPQGVWITTIITTTATFITIITGIVFIVWFVRDIRKENSKNLKIQTETLNKHTEILMKIEEGQREGFQNLQQSSERQIKSLENIEKSLEIQTKILAKIEAK